MVVILLGIAVTVWKVSTARKLATRSGMDPGLATQMTLLTDNGLDATYLAASLRQPSPSVNALAAPAPVRDASTRLAELKGLLDRGVVTQAEYDAQRQAIIDSV
jgi:Short C-terminal domain